MDKIAQLQEIIDQSQRIVFFGGAGVSTESNIPDFRSSDGVYSLKLGRLLLPSNLFHAPCLSAIQRIFLTSTKSISSIQMPSRI